jgi:hypothetical protein
MEREYDENIGMISYITQEGGIVMTQVQVFAA